MAHRLYLSIAHTFLLRFLEGRIGSEGVREGFREQSLEGLFAGFKQASTCVSRLTSLLSNSRRSTHQHHTKNQNTLPPSLSGGECDHPLKGVATTRRNSRPDQHHTVKLESTGTSPPFPRAFPTGGEWDRPPLRRRSRRSTPPEQKTNPPNPPTTLRSWLRYRIFFLLD